MVMPETETALLSVRVGQNYKELPEPFHWSRIVPPKFIPVVGSTVWVRDQDGSIFKDDYWVRIGDARN